jgi:hypothetical protein
MKTSEYSKYGPEDFEELLLHKSYDELLEEEKAYVLLYLNSPEEYEGMRRLLLSTCGKKPDAADLVKPGKETKERLLLRFNEHHKTDKLAWLNVWLAPLFSLQPNTRLALGSLAIILIVSGIFLINYLPLETNTQADNKFPVKETPPNIEIQDRQIALDDVQDAPAKTSVNPESNKKLAKPEQILAENKISENYEHMSSSPGRESEAAFARKKTQEVNLASSNLAEHAELMQLLYTEL